MKQITDEQTLVLARGRFDMSIPVYDDGYGELYVMRDSIGIVGIVRARSWADAYEICEDEFFVEASETIEELQKEYGFRREHKKVIMTPTGERYAEPDDYPLQRGQFQRWDTIETPDPDSWPDNELFQEAFGFRPNGPNMKDQIGHGIYAKDLNGERLDVLTMELAEEVEIQIETRDIESRLEDNVSILEG